MLAEDLKAHARSLGFHLVGITSAEPFSQAEVDITEWLAKGHNGEMAWLTMARAHLATHPSELLEGARSLVVVGVSYRTEEPSSGPGGRVARYAWGYTKPYLDSQQTNKQHGSEYGLPFECWTCTSPAR